MELTHLFKYEFFFSVFMNKRIKRFLLNLAFIMMTCCGVMAVMMVYYTFKEPHIVIIDMNTINEYWFEFSAINLLFFGSILLWLICQKIIYQLSEDEDKEICKRYFK